MKNRAALLTLYQATTGKTTHKEIPRPVPEYGYQVSRCKEYRYGGDT